MTLARLRRLQATGYSPERARHSAEPVIRVTRPVFCRARSGCGL
jgi:hypothetical protein